MPEIQGVSSERLNTLAKKAAAKAVRKEKERVENNIPDDLDQDDIADFINSEASGVEPRLILNGPGFDIFDHCQKLLDERQTQAVYTISKNGELLCTKHHPYSWERLQREYGGGHYQIVAKTINGKQYIKSDTRTVADLPIGADVEEKEAAASTFDRFALMMQQQREQDRREMKEALERQRAEEERRRLEEKERTKETIATSQTQSMMMIEMMKMMNEKSERAALEIAKMQQMAEERAAKANEKNTQLMIQMMQMQMQAQSNQNKSDTSISPVELLKLQKEAEEAGFNKFFQLMNLARAEAEERIALREEGSGDKKEKKSLTDTLIESMLPTITSALTNPAALTKVPVQQPRRSLQQAAGVRPAALAEKNQRVGAEKVGKGNAPQKEPGHGGSGITERGALGLPTINFKKVKSAEISNSSVLPKVPTVEEIETWLSPVITEALLNQTPPNDAAPKVVDVVKNHGLSKENFCKIMTEDKLLGLVNKYGLPEIAFDWFKELHAHISTTTGDDDRQHA